MILTCPACATRFLVPDAAFGFRPRRVRCGKCRHDWLAEPPVPEPVAMPEVSPYLSMEETPEPVTPPPAAPQPIPEGSNLPVPARDRLLLVRILIVLALLLALAGIGGTYLYLSATGRDLSFGHLFAAAPEPLQLAIENVTTKYVEAPTGDGTDPNAPKAWQLVVEGTIRNKGDTPATLPPLVMATKDSGGALIQLYRPEVQMKSLPPGGTTGFTHTLREVSDKLAEVTVEFGSSAPAAAAVPHGD